MRFIPRLRTNPELRAHKRRVSRNVRLVTNLHRVPCDKVPSMRFGRTTPEPSTAEKIDRVRERLHVISAIADALGRLDQLMEIVSTSRDPEDARARIQAAFNLDELQAYAILDAQFRNATLIQVEHIRNDRDELLVELRQLQAKV